MSILDKISSVKTVLAVIENILKVVLKCLDVILSSETVANA